MKPLQKIAILTKLHELSIALQIKFSTLSEYFDAVNSDINQGALTPPSLSGDFFAYSDAGRDYWTGYYTSRAFHKATERQLMSLLRYSPHVNAMYISTCLMTKTFQVSSNTVHLNKCTSCQGNTQPGPQVPERSIG